MKRLTYLVFAFSILVFLAPAKARASTTIRTQQWQIISGPDKKVLVQQIQSHEALYKIDPNEIESIQKSEDGVVAIQMRDGSTAFYAVGGNKIYDPELQRADAKKEPETPWIDSKAKIRGFLTEELASLAKKEPYPREEIEYLTSALRAEYIYGANTRELFPLIDFLKNLPPRTEIINLEADLIEKFIVELDDKEKVDLIPRIYELMNLAEPINNPSGDKKDDNLVRFYQNSRSYEYTFHANPWKELFSSYMTARSVTAANPSLTNTVPLDKIIETLRAKGITVEEITDVSD